MKTAKLGAIFLVAIMSMTALGAAYAHWEETLTITGIMETDDIDVGFFCDDSNDPQDENTMDPTDCGYWDNYEWFGERRWKNVGWMDVLVPSDDNNILKITIGDAYPCYYAHAFWCVRNSGSCPVLVHSIQLTELSYEGEVFRLANPVTLRANQWYFIKIFTDPDTGEPTGYDIYVGTPSDPEAYDFSIMPTGNFDIDVQLDPLDWQGSQSQHMMYPDNYMFELPQDLCIHFENGCRQDVKYDFTIEVVYYNWPEYVGDPPWGD